MLKLSRLAFASGLTVALLAGSAALAQEKTFNVWWFETPDSSEGIAWTKALDEFKAKHPDVKVNYELKTFDQMEKAGSMILNSNQAPDVLEFNKGNGTAGLVASQGLLTELGDVYKQRGWDKLLNDADTQLAKYDENGIYGSGPLIGVPVYGEFVSVFYNKDMFAANNLKVPTTLEEMEADMDVFVKKGITPLTVGAVDSNAQHLTYELALHKADTKWVENYQGLKAPLDPAPYLYAGQKLAEWTKKGYISKDATGLKGDDAALIFETGKAPMMVTGTWYSGAFNTKIKNFKWGQFLFPGNQYSPASTGNLWVVPKSAKNKDLAYDFIDLTLSKENQTALGNAGGVAIAVDPSAITDPVGKQSVSLFKEIADKNGLGFYPDWPVPGFYDVVLQGTEAVIAGTATPEQFADRLKKAYDDGQAAVGQ